MSFSDDPSYESLPSEYRERLEACVDVSHFTMTSPSVRLGFDIDKLRWYFGLNKMLENSSSIDEFYKNQDSYCKFVTLVELCKLLDDSTLSDNTLILLINQAFDICYYFDANDYRFWHPASHVLYVGIAMLLKRERSADLVLKILCRAYDDGDGVDILNDLWDFSVRKYHWSVGQIAVIIENNSNFGDGFYSESYDLWRNSYGTE